LISFDGDTALVLSAWEHNTTVVEARIRVAEEVVGYLPSADRIF
jgi:hypothetical protein